MLLSADEVHKAKNLAPELKSVEQARIERGGKTKMSKVCLKCAIITAWPRFHRALVDVPSWSTLSSSLSLVFVGLRFFTFLSF